jgi:hypothetical protein
METANLWVQIASFKRLIWLLVLTTAAALIVNPYFGYKVPFGMLWLRLFVVALVMMVTFIATEAIWRSVPNPRLSLLTAQLVSVRERTSRIARNRFAKTGARGASEADASAN